jgi:hypothetical protein
MRPARTQRLGLPHRMRPRPTIHASSAPTVWANMITKKSAVLGCSPAGGQNVTMPTA